MDFVTKYYTSNFCCFLISKLIINNHYNEKELIGWLIFIKRSYKSGRGYFLWRALPMSSNHILLICTDVLIFWSDLYFGDYRSNSGFDVYDDCGLDRLSTYGAMNAVSTSFPAKVTNCTENKTIYNLGKANIKLEVSLHHIIKINMLDASNKKNYTKFIFTFV